MIGEILFFICAAWALCILLALVILMIDEDSDVEDSVVFLFPANLIFIIKYFWKAIVKATKA